MENNQQENDLNTNGEQDLEKEASSATEETLDTDEPDKVEVEEDSFKDKYYYVAAELQNQQRRFEKEKENLLKYGSEKILRDILDVVDNFERTLGFISNDNDEKVKNIAVGIDMINNQLIETLTKHGLKKLMLLGKRLIQIFMKH